MIRRTVILAPLLAALTLGCGGGGGGGGGVEPGPTPSPLVNEGWDAFEIGDYVTAATKFQKAIDENAFSAAAHNGLGFSNMKLDNFLQAIANFDAAITNGFAGADPHAGKAVILRDIDPVDYSAAIAAAKAALVADADFIFAHDTSLDHKDLRLVLAQSYFALAQYSDANSEVAALGGNVQDEQSPTFVDDLLAEIERLGDLIRS